MTTTRPFRRSTRQVDALKAELRAALESKEYRKSHGSFRDYCKAVHNISPALAYRYTHERHNSKVKVPESLRWDVWERDNFTCLNCGSRKFLRVDHIIPESKGGTTTIGNLQTLCHSCNSKKGTRCGVMEVAFFCLNLMKS
jgi:5-methylcytosine-specific restriction endonuclease McrA